MLPSTEVKTHVVTFKDTDDALYVTSDVATRLSQFRNHPNSVSFPLINSTTGNLIRDIGKYEIKSIQLIKKEERFGGRVIRLICDYGVRHYMHEKCEDANIYCCPQMGVLIPLDFLSWCRKRFPNYPPKYTSDINQIMRDKFLEEKGLITNQK